jgi:hypothetical protein
MAAKFELKRNERGLFHFKLKAGNDQIILTSGTYAAKVDALRGIDAVRRHAPDDTYFVRKQSPGGEPYFVLKAGNGEAIGKSEIYSGRAALENGIASVKRTAAAAPIDDTTA